MTDINAAFWAGRSVFVTGATGLLGSHLCGSLADLGSRVVALVRDQVPTSWFVTSGTRERVTVVSGCLEDADLLARALNEYDIDTVFHLGAQTIVPYARRLPAVTYEVNVRGTWNLLEACRLNRETVRRIVIASSDKAYGTQPRLPYTEEMPLLAIHPYDVSKACADMLARASAHSQGLPVVVTRLANLYGPGDGNRTRLIPEVCQAIAGNTAPIIRSDGTPRRDYIFVEDAVGAYLMTAQALEELHLAGEAFNFGNSEPQTVLEVVEALRAAAPGTPSAPIIEGRGVAATEIPEQWLDCTKARRVLGWRPTVAMADGLRQTLEWYLG